jgi:hypothetical protein
MAATTETAIDAAAEAQRAQAAAREAHRDAQTAERELEAFVTAANVRPEVLRSMLVPGDPHDALRSRLYDVLRRLRRGESLAPTERDEVLEAAAAVAAAKIIDDAITRMAPGEFSQLDRAEAQRRVNAALAHRRAASGAAHDAKREAESSQGAWMSVEGAKHELSTASNVHEHHPQGLSDAQRAEREAIILESSERSRVSADNAEAAARRAADELQAVRVALAGKET